jgi:esterase/lipase superfamily enzyme
VGADRLVVAGHSLGGRVVSTALTRPIVPRPPDATPLHALAFLALNHDAEYFADTLVPQLRTLTHRLVPYSTRRDRVLTISRRMHDAPRAGRAEPVPLARDGLETLDVTDGWAADRLWQRLVGNRHSIRRASATLFDFAYVVVRRLDGACREHTGLGARQSPTVWTLTPARPDTSRLSDCAPHGDPAFLHALLR